MSSGAVPGPFDFDLTVRSHGWYDLPPWSYDAEQRVLGRPLNVSTGAVYAEVRSPAGRDDRIALIVKSEKTLTSQARREAEIAVRTCLALDEDFTPFYRLVADLEAHPPRSIPLPRLAWVIERGAGRLLRSPTVFEDAVKTLCTTNCSWALTRAMVIRLVEQLGEPAPRGSRTFPTPESMARRTDNFYREVVRSGYRAPFLLKLARAVADGRIDIESWRHSDLATDQLHRNIRALAGFGPYATEHLLKLLGRYDYLALDSWSRATLARIRGKGRIPSDKTIAKWYSPYGKYAGLAFWLEVTSEWHQNGPVW